MEAVIILAGGSGTRLWPASTRARPKQFLAPGRELSFLQESVERGLAAGPGAEIVVVTHRDYVGETVSQLARYAASGAEVTILPEPAGRNTAPAIALAAAYLGGRLDGSARALVLSADHLIHPQELFTAAAGKADELAARGCITVFGIPPTEPHTGYGYIQAGEAEGPGFRVRAFREKPDAATASRYIAAGGHFWNSGMFLFSLRVMEEELAAHAPEIAGPFRRLGRAAAAPPKVTDLKPVAAGATLPGTAAAPPGAAGLKPGAAAPPGAAGLNPDAAGAEAGGRMERGVRIWGEGDAVRDLYEKLPSISIDYAVMEKSRRAAMVPADFSWTDLGSWDEAARLLPDEAPRVLSVESENCSVFSDLPVALCGVKDLVVVIRNGHALVLKKGSSQLVRDAAREMDP